VVSGLVIDKPICHLNLAQHYRGGERQTELLLRELAKRGKRQRLIIKRGNSLGERCADVDGLEIREVGSNPIAAGLAVKGSRVAHAHDGRTVYSGLVASLLFNVPYIITRRVVAPQSRKRLRAWAYNRATAVAAISQAAADELQKRQPEVDSVIIPDGSTGFDVSEAEVEQIRSTRAGKTLIGHVGALDNSHKGQSTIIEAARIAATEHPDWHFLLCGNGRDEQRFRDEIGSLRNIELIGWVENVGDYLASFDVFIYPSLHEALGSILLDAMQSGLPIVASNVGGIPSVVEDAVNGDLIDPGNAQQLLASLAALLSNPDRMQAMAQTNRERARQYSSVRMADAYERLYDHARA
jgi:glycosyltransferase involved in cell wall biosynthesis